MMHATIVRRATTALLASAVVLGGAGVAIAQSAPEDAQDGTSGARATKFTMVRSTGAVNAGCLQGAGADVTVKELGVVEKMTVTVHDLPDATEFDLFVTQDSEAPFGIAWYQSDLKTDQSGNGSVTVEGRFNIETFAVATGTTDAPVTHDDQPFPDADANPPFAPIHTYHVGLWFNSPADAAAAGCPSTVTPFNGEHNAGIQALSTRNFPQLEGPLSRIG